MEKRLDFMIKQLFDIMEMTLLLQTKLILLVGIEVGEIERLMKDTIKDTIRENFDPSVDEMDWIKGHKKEFKDKIEGRTREMSDKLKTHISYYYNINNIKEEKE